jgi:hypothetical protein
MCFPRVEERRMIKAFKRDGYVQYGLTIPKKYAETLEARGVSSFYVVYNDVLVAFPKGLASEADLASFLKLHPELAKLTAKEKEA